MDVRESKYSREQQPWLSPPVAHWNAYLKRVISIRDLKDIYGGMMQFLVMHKIGPNLIFMYPILGCGYRT
ncbi:MAG: hypothetical protein DHS20C01_01310 [marine bacterium B5-7]|nr:MAG: hypothetical protein DHS20C01_01310 [marine bacterium B5-7]